MALLEAWPGRGFWPGTSHGRLGGLSGMTLSMAVTPQPRFLSGWLAGFAALDEAHGFAVNLLAVTALALVGAAFLSGRPRLIRPVLAGFTVMCLAVWVLIQDLGFPGGVGTDPNSMIPFILLAAAGYLALTRAPPAGTRAACPARPPAEVPVPPAAVPGPGSSWRFRIGPAALGQRAAAASTRSLVAVGAAGLLLLGAVPLAVAQASATADPILAQSVAGSAAPEDYPAPGFALTDQYGQTADRPGAPSGRPDARGERAAS